MLGLAVGVPVCVFYATDPLVQQCGFVLLASGAGIAAICPLQYIPDISTIGGCRAAFALHLLHLVEFGLMRFYVGWFPWPGSFPRVLFGLIAEGKETTAYMASGGLLTMFAFNLLLIMLFGERVAKNYASIGKVRALLAADKGKTADADWRKMIWEQAKCWESMHRLPADLLRDKLSGKQLLKAGIGAVIATSRFSRSMANKSK